MAQSNVNTVSSDAIVVGTPNLSGTPQVMTFRNGQEWRVVAAGRHRGDIVVATIPPANHGSDTEEHCF